MGISTNPHPKKGQRYQNTFQFKHNKSSKKTKIIESMPISGLCTACVQKIQWRKTFRKYKPLTVPKKCVRCSQKTVTESYHILCKPCARASSSCEKCLQPLFAQTASDHHADDIVHVEEQAGTDREILSDKEEISDTDFSDDADGFEDASI